MLVQLLIYIGAVLATAAEECPPCFNCALPGFECTHFGSCDDSIGRCDCITGFGGLDCAEPLCGGMGHGKLRENGTKCHCDDGWSGINCNMCGSNQACDAFMPSGEHGTCYTGGILVRENFHMCNVTNRKVQDLLGEQKAQVTFGCNRNDSRCDLQFWIDELESFYCKFEECEFDASSNHTVSQCAAISCECVPDRMLCGAANSIDISEWLKQSVKGPGDLDCNQDGKCTFNEPAMNQLIKFVFGDSSITLECNASECMHYSEVPGYEPPQPQLNKLWVTVTIAVVMLMLFGAGYGAQSLFNRKDKVEMPLDSTQTLNTKPISLVFENIGYRVHDKQILQAVSGSAPSGQVLAIMGGSGAGKTTLLDILAAKNKMGEVEGEIYTNGSLISKDYYKLIGYVDQHDELLPTLSVYETICTSAYLRLPKTMSKQAKTMRAIETMQELGILHLKDSLIGSSGQRAISGGEKRRVAIACELVTSPSVLFLDEPTSGLDSFNAYNVVECLVNLAKNSNRTVVFTIHQPRSNIVALFDKFLLLAQGQVVFQGTPDDALTHFDRLGYKCPEGYNIADFLVDLTMRARITDQAGCDSHGRLVSALEPQEQCMDPQVHQQPVEDQTRVWEDAAYHESSRQSAAETQNETVHQDWHETHGLQPLFRAYENSHHASSVREQVRAAKSNPQDVAASKNDDRIGLFSQFLILSNRTFKNLYRNPMLVFAHYAIAVVLGLFCGVLYYQVAFDISGFQNRLGLFFFLLALFGFSTLSMINLFGVERIIFVRERANGYYHPFAYYCAKVLLDIMPLRVLPPILLGVIVYPLVGLNVEDGAPLKFLLVLVLFNLASATTMLVIGIMIEDYAVASLTGCLVNLFGILFAGLFLNQDSMGPAFAWLKYCSVFHYAYEALSVNEVRYLSLVEDKFGLKIEVPGATILSAFGFDNEGVPRDIAGLAVFASIFLILGYLCTVCWLVEKR